MFFRTGPVSNLWICLTVHFHIFLCFLLILLFFMFYQDLSKLNRNPAQVIYLSAHALESCLQHANCVQIKPFKLEDKYDTQLLDLIPFLECECSNPSLIL
jgi:hypothetical protein